MKYLSKIILIFSGLFFLGCGLSNAKQTITFEDKFALDLPAFFVKLSDDFVPEASLCYGNSLTDFYALVIEDFIPTEEEIEQGETMEANLEEISLEDYLDSYKFTTDSRREKDFSGEEKLITIGEFPAYYIEGKIIPEDGTELFFVRALVKGKKGFYQIITCSLFSKKEKYKPAMQEIVYSFRELGD